MLFFRVHAGARNRVISSQNLNFILRKVVFIDLAISSISSTPGYEEVRAGWNDRVYICRYGTWSPEILSA